MNQSTYEFLERTLEKTRGGLLRSNARLFCRDCLSVHRVTDFFPNKECLLECGHRRPIVDVRVIAAFEREQATRPARKKVSKGSASAQLEVVYEEGNTNEYSEHHHEKMGI